MCFSKIAAWFRGLKGVEGGKVKGDIFKRLPRYARVGHGGPNMPMYQPCPQCGAGCKRDYKTVDGAVYRCTSENFTFLVERPRMKPHIPVHQHSK